MEKSRKYNTKQREMVLQALQATPGRHLTAEDILAALQQQGQDIGSATVYRNLDKLAKEGVILKYSLPEGLGACYQYLGQEDAASHCHVVCTGCGQVEHLVCQEMDTLAEHLMEHQQLDRDRRRTVLYAACPLCRRK